MTGMGWALACCPSAYSWGANNPHGWRHQCPSSEGNQTTVGVTLQWSCVNRHLLLPWDQCRRLLPYPSTECLWGLRALSHGVGRAVGYGGPWPRLPTLGWVSCCRACSGGGLGTESCSDSAGMWRQCSAGRRLGNTPAALWCPPAQALALSWTLLGRAECSGNVSQLLELRRKGRHRLRAPSAASWHQLPCSSGFL